MRQFAASVERLLVIEEGDPYLVESLRAAGIAVESEPEMYRFGELNVERVRRILARRCLTGSRPPSGQAARAVPRLPAPHGVHALRNLDCIVAGDIGCYTLGVLPPFKRIDTCVCMGASIGIGLGMRHVLPPEQARRVVSVIGDSTFIHSGITGLVEMVYNPPPTGHVVIILDNGTTAMTGMQEHPATGRSLDHHRAGKVVIEDLVRALGIHNIRVLDPTRDPAAFQQLVADALASGELSLIVARRDCLLATRKIKSYEAALREACVG